MLVDTSRMSYRFASSEEIRQVSAIRKVFRYSISCLAFAAVIYVNYSSIQERSSEGSRVRDVIFLTTKPFFRESGSRSMEHIRRPRAPNNPIREIFVFGSLFSHLNTCEPEFSSSSVTS